MRKMMASVALALAVAGNARAQDTGIPVGAMAPDAMVHTLDGKSVNLASYIGKKPVLIEFWATWCPLCKQLEPQLTAAKEKYGEQISFIGVNVPQNQTPAKVKEFVERNSMKGTFLFDTDGAAYKAFSAPHTSYLVVIDKTGKVVYTGVGGTQNIEAAIAKLGDMGMDHMNMKKGGHNE